MSNTNPYKEHEVIGKVEREHSMNGRPCPNLWNVLKIIETGSIIFYCPECSVGHHSGSMYDELMEIWTQSSKE